MRLEFELLTAVFVSPLLDFLSFSHSPLSFLSLHLKHLYEHLHI